MKCTTYVKISKFQTINYIQLIFRFRTLPLPSRYRDFGIVPSRDRYVRYGRERYVPSRYHDRYHERDFYKKGIYAVNF